MASAGGCRQNFEVAGVIAGIITYECAHLFARLHQGPYAMGADKSTGAGDQYILQ